MTSFDLFPCPQAYVHLQEAPGTSWSTSHPKNLPLSLFQLPWPSLLLHQDPSLLLLKCTLPSASSELPLILQNPPQSFPSLEKVLPFLAGIRSVCLHSPHPPPVPLQLRERRAGTGPSVLLAAQGCHRLNNGGRALPALAAWRRPWQG